MDFDDVADELYGLRPDEFIAARNRLAKQARDAGDRQLAGRIQALRKPSAAAWLANALVREHRDEIEPLFELGRELRDVMGNLTAEELRELTQRRFQLVSALVRRAQGIARGRGQRVNADTDRALRETLEATLADADSAGAVAAGRLSDAISVSGFGASGQPQPAYTPAQEEPTGGTVTELDGQRKRRDARRDAERELAEADADAKLARDESAGAKARVEETRRQRADASSTVDRLRLELDKALADLEQRELEERSALDQLTAAEARAKAAQDHLATARRQLRALRS
jgi:hypothetical protein